MAIDATSIAYRESALNIPLGSLFSINLLSLFLITEDC